MLQLLLLPLSRGFRPFVCSRDRDDQNQTRTRGQGKEGGGAET